MSYPARVILNRLAQLYPRHANTIRNAQAASYPAEVILRRLVDNGDEEDLSDKSLTEHEKVQRRDKGQKRKAALQALGVLGTAGAIGAGAIGYATRNSPVRPSQITSPGRISPRGGPQQGATINITPRQGRIGGKQPPGIGFSPQGPTPKGPKSSRGPTPQSPQGSTQNIPITPEYKHNPKTNIDLVKNLKEDKRIGQAIASGLEMPAIVQALKSTLPKSKLALLERAPGGFEQVLQDYSSLLKNQVSTQKKNEALQQFNDLKKRKPSLIEEEHQRLTEGYPQLNDDPNQLQFDFDEQQSPVPEMAQSGAIPEQSHATDTYEAPPTDLFAPRQAQQSTQLGPLDQRVTESAQGRANLQEPQSDAIRSKSFYVPNYKHADESHEEFAERKILYNLVNKGAKAITEGKSFLDFPKAPGVQYSTAADVLRFMGGIPNLYDALLDDSEKEEMMAALTDTGTITQKGMQPMSGEKPTINGAQLAPNLVWNLLLSIEPKLATMKKPPSVKGYKMSTGNKMGTSEMRRSLTHLVYGVLSGKTVSNELSDKIAKISKASSSIDAIVKAAKDGDRRRMDEEMERILKDDAYFLDLMNSVAERQLPPEEQEKADLLAKEDTKSAAAIKAKATREKNKKAKPKNDD